MLFFTLFALSQDDFDWVDPNEEVYVLQNRIYEKNKRFYIGLSGGFEFSQPYKNVFEIAPRAGFYFTEKFGIEGYFKKSFNQDNNHLEALRVASPNALPVIREFNFEVGGLALFSPFYAKMNVFNEIIYFDWIFKAGAAALVSDVDLRRSFSSSSLFQTQNHFAFLIGMEQQIHVHKNFFFSLDTQASFYQAPVYGDRGADAWFSRVSILFGLGARF